jgi:hypothetical protein
MAEAAVQPVQSAPMSLLAALQPLAGRQLPHPYRLPVRGHSVNE